MESSMQPAPLAKVGHEELEKFLRRHGEAWNVDGDSAFEEHLEHSPMTTDELLAAIGSYAPFSKDVFVFSDQDTADAIVASFPLDRAPQVDARGLEGYIIRSVRGNDVLWFACSAEQASNGSYVTLLPCD